MPGLLGLSTISTPHISSRVDAARERMLRHDRMTMDLVASRDQSGWLGHTRLDGSPRTIVDGGERPSAVFHGVLHNEAELRRQFGGSSLVEATGDLIAAMYERHGAAFVPKLEGEFVVAVMDPVRRTMLVASDPIGNYPLYWHHSGQDFVFSSDLSALLRAVPSRTRLNLQAVADFLTIGAVLENKTLVKDVWLLDAGTVLQFDLERGQVQATKYLDITSFFAQKPREKAEYLDAVAVAFKGAVERAVADSRPIGLSLSGGIDSRTILGALNDRAAGLHTYTLGVAGCADQTIARQLAAIAKTNHRFFEMDGSALRDFLPNMSAMVSTSDGLYLSHGLTEMLALRFLGETGIGVLLRGHGGELAKAHLAWPLQTDAHAYSGVTVDAFLPYLADRANYVTRGLALDRILAPWAAAEAGVGSLASFRRVLSQTTLTPAEACSYLYLCELHRRFTVPSLELFRTRVEVRMPFVDVAFLRVLLGAPAEWRDSTDIHQRITKSGMPELLKVRNSNTGAAVDASPTIERVMDKINSALKKFNVHGYRHYHNYDEWMRLSLLQSVEAELAGEWARTRGFITRNTIVSLAKEMVEGKNDRSYLLQTLLILELWMRENRIEAAA
jgi:asparagine synthase (glutamine-hydrolysing)